MDIDYKLSNGRYHDYYCYEIIKKSKTKCSAHACLFCWFCFWNFIPDKAKRVLKVHKPCTHFQKPLINLINFKKDFFLLHRDYLISFQRVFYSTINIEIDYLDSMFWGSGFFILWLRNLILVSISSSRYPLCWSPTKWSSSITTIPAEIATTL